MAKKYNRLLLTTPIYDKIPLGWAEIKGASTAPVGYTWISNNKSYFSGERKQALLKKITNGNIHE